MPFTISHIAAVLPGYRLLTRAHVFSGRRHRQHGAGFRPAAAGSLGALADPQLRGAVHLLPAGGTRDLLAHAAADQAGGARSGAGSGLSAAARGTARRASIRQPMAWLYAAVALLLGAVTHLIWDAFTHENARGVRMFPLLTRLWSGDGRSSVAAVSLAAVWQQPRGPGGGRCRRWCCGCAMRRRRLERPLRRIGAERASGMARRLPAAADAGHGMAAAAAVAGRTSPFTNGASLGSWRSTACGARRLRCCW